MTPNEEPNEFISRDFKEAGKAFLDWSLTQKNREYKLWLTAIKAQWSAISKKSYSEYWWAESPLFLNALALWQASNHGGFHLGP